MWKTGQKADVFGGCELQAVEKADGRPEKRFFAFGEDIFSKKKRGAP